MPSAKALRAGKATIELSLLKGAVEKQLATLQARVATIGHAFTKTGSMALAASAAIGAPLAATIKLASNAAESLNKFNSVFGAQADMAAEFANSLAKSVGRSRVEIQDALSAFQGLFVGLGFDPSKARELSQQMQSLAIDFASFHNLSDQEAVERFISALSGSSEVLDRFGINTKQAALQQELLSRGISKSWTEVTESEKAISRLNVIMQAMTSQGAVGDAVKTAGSFANRLKALKARVQDVGVEIGTTLLPVANEWLGRILEIAKGMSEWVSQNKEMFVSLATLTVKVAAAGLAMIGIGKIIAATSGLIHALRTAITLLTAHPLVALVTLLGTAAVAALHFSGALDGVYDWLAKITGISGEASSKIQGVAAAMTEASSKQLSGLTGTAAAEFRSLSEAMSDVIAKQGELTLADKIADMEKQIRESEARLHQRERTIRRVEERAGRTGEIVDPQDLDKLRIEQERLARLRKELLALKAPAPQLEDPLGFGDIQQADLARAAIEFAKNVKDKLADAILGATKDAELRAAPLKKVNETQKKVDEHLTAAQPQSFFDTRLAKQMAGGNQFERQQLAALIKIEKNTSRRQRGIPVI